mmetsp:Transcript_707/g.1637  ORF Transcript_707/g.1637 Transcript_707/m.1637 type:complete len:439 (-) Transcript_707:762-2078(-)
MACLQHAVHAFVVVVERDLLPCADILVRKHADTGAPLDNPYVGGAVGVAAVVDEARCVPLVACIHHTVLSQRDEVVLVPPLLLVLLQALCTLLCSQHLAHVLDYELARENVFPRKQPLALLLGVQRHHLAVHAVLQAHVGACHAIGAQLGVALVVHGTVVARVAARDAVPRPAAAHEDVVAAHFGGRARCRVLVALDAGERVACVVHRPLPVVRRLGDEEVVCLLQRLEVVAVARTLELLGHLGRLVLQVLRHVLHVREVGRAQELHGDFRGAALLHVQQRRVLLADDHRGPRPAGPQVGQHHVARHDGLAGAARHAQPVVARVRGQGLHLLHQAGDMKGRRAGVATQQRAVLLAVRADVVVAAHTALVQGANYRAAVYDNIPRRQALPVEHGCALDAPCCVLQKRLLPACVTHMHGTHKGVAAIEGCFGENGCTCGM